MNEHGDGWFDAERAICIDEMEKAAGSEKHGDLVELYNSTFYGCEAVSYTHLTLPTILLV